jgi:DNA primase
MAWDPTYSFAWLKERVGIGQVLEAYGLHLHLGRRGDCLVGPCPLHGGDHPTAFRADLQRGVWHCWTHCGGGDVVDLVRRIHRCDHAEAARHLRMFVLGCAPPPVAVSSSASVSESASARAFRPFTFRIPLDPNVPFLQENKRISAATALRFEAGTTAMSSFLRGTVAVRLHDLRGQPLGYCGRRLDPESIRMWGKWRFPRGFPKSECLFGAHRALLHRARGIVVVECPWAAMRLHQAGILGAVALLGTQLSTTQGAWLALAPRVTLLFDGDAAGREAAEHTVAILDERMSVHVRELPWGLEPEDLDDESLRDLVQA